MRVDLEEELLYGGLCKYIGAILFEDFFGQLVRFRTRRAESHDCELYLPEEPEQAVLLENWGESDSIR